MGQSMFSYELTFWLISIVNGCKHQDKNSLRVEINQFGDGKCDTVSGSFAIDKIEG